MPKPRARRVDQVSIYETVLDKPELEEKLESREKMKDAVSTAQHNFKIHDEQARAELEKLDLGDDAPVRVGRFLIVRKPVKGRSVSFETEPTVRLKIKILDE